MLQDDAWSIHAVAMHEEVPPVGARGDRDGGCGGCGGCGCGGGCGGGGISATFFVVPLQLPKQSGARYVILAQVVLGGSQSEHV
jgi:hypothetical protein